MGDSLPSSTERLELDALRRDLWPRQTLAMARGELPPAPAEVVWPRSADEVRAALDRAEATGRAVVPFGAGSGVCGAAAGREGALVVDLKRMNRILDFDARARTVRVQPGLLGQHLEDWLAPRGFMSAHSPSSIACSTIGGYAAARSAGQFSSRYGVFDDMLLAASLEAPEGTVRAGAWTPKGQEDLLPVLCGSEGALGVFTELLVRVVPLPERRWLRGYAFPNLVSAWSAMRGLLQAGLWPSVIRLYDPLDTRLNRSTRPPAPAATGRSLLKRMHDLARRTPGLGAHLAELPLAMPGLLNAVFGTLGTEVALILGFEGPADLVSAQVELAGPILAAARDLGPGPGERWFQHRHSVSYKLAPVFLGGGFADTMEVAATWSKLEGLHDAVRAAIGRHGLVMAHFSHAYPEGCSIYFSFAGKGELSTYDALWQDALQAAVEAGGTVTHHHGVGPLKARAAAIEAGAAVRVWRDLKAQLDPAGRMNPGRLFPEDQPEAPGPPPPDPRLGPVFAVDETSLLAEVDPNVPPSQVEAALQARGLALRIRPDRALGPWLIAQRREALDPWECPVFAVQARFEDGTSARIGPAPRSAAGPDLRRALLRRARAELVQVPVRRLHPDRPMLICAADPAAGDPRELRPAWRAPGRWAFEPDQQAIVDSLGLQPSPSGSTLANGLRRSPTAPRVPE
jgi:alkyldihydroxyacetonephosphate synthase